MKLKFEWERGMRRDRKTGGLNARRSSHQTAPHGEQRPSLRISMAQYKTAKILVRANCLNNGQLMVIGSYLAVGRLPRGISRWRAGEEDEAKEWGWALAQEDGTRAGVWPKINWVR